MYGNTSEYKGILAIIYLDGSHFTMGILKIGKKDLIWMISVWIGIENPGYISWAQKFQSQVRKQQLVSNNRLNALIHGLNTKNQLETIDNKDHPDWERNKPLAITGRESFNHTVGTAQRLI